MDDSPMKTNIVQVYSRQIKILIRKMRTQTISLAIVNAKWTYGMREMFIVPRKNKTNKNKFLLLRKNRFAVNFVLSETAFNPTLQLCWSRFCFCAERDHGNICLVPS
jgi:hypothetical protein